MITLSPLILASTSKYRRELLERLAIPFTCHSPGIDEEAWKRKGLPPAELARELAIAKSHAVWSKHPDAVVIGSDQVAEVDGQILDKPVTRERAIEQLGLLSGKTHHLWTAVAISSHAGCDIFIDKTTLTMRSLTVEEMARYVAHDQPLYCAGSYKLESLGITLFESIISADQTAIIGLPLLETARRLREHGFQLP